MALARALAPVVALTLVPAPAAGALAQTELQRSRRTPVVEVFEKCRDAVVNISTTRLIQVRSPFGFDSIWDEMFDLPRSRTQQVSSVGSGFVVHEDGYIVTNAHVVAQTADIRVGFADKEQLPAEVVSVDPEHDLAILKVEANRGLAHLHLARPDDVLVGETVIAIGNPLGLQHTCTAGIVSAVGRDIQFSPSVIYRNLIQTDTPINPGNSGGPLLNVNGELLGVNTAIRGDAQNIGFAIPVRHLWELLPSMLDIERRERVRLGLQVAGWDARVTAIRPGSPAERAGVRAGDRVVRLNGQPLSDSIDYYARLLRQKPGSKLNLQLQRGDKAVTVAVPLEELPKPDGAKLAQALLGVTLAPVPQRLRRELELPRSVAFAIAQVEPGSPAERARLRPGDIVVRLGGMQAPDSEALGNILEQVTPGERIVFQVIRTTDDSAILWTDTIRTRAAG
ncbi:MAG: hypothetical protein CHACPFDD_03437 [Phycisphaerae bacterium]|nr:hypothetical protein [Phycisphaerae bacterium]